MKNKVYVHAPYLISSLGLGLKENRDKLFEGKSGSLLIQDKTLYPKTFFASKINRQIFDLAFANLFPKLKDNYPFFEQILIFAIQQSINQYPKDLKGKDTLLILSSTKGNVSLLEPAQKVVWEADRVFLWKSAEIIQRFFGLKNRVVVLSNACISGIEAISIGSRLIRHGRMKNVIVAGADILSEFIVSGFQSFQSMSPELCRPYDEERKGLNLGEAAGALILSAEKEDDLIQVLGSGVSNDANHISGPSRTGDGLYLAIKSAMEESGLTADAIDYISGHGTATNYNDEMEGKAFQLASLENTPLNSLKAYWGHTLGAAGLIESIAAMESMKANILIPSLAYSKHGVSVPLNIIEKKQHQKIDTVLKTASGFGGANAAIIFKKGGPNA